MYNLGGLEEAAEKPGRSIEKQTIHGKRNIMSNAQLQKINGSPAIVVDGKVYPPMTITIAKQDSDPGYLKRLGEAGIRIFYVGCEADWINKDEKPQGCSEKMDKFCQRAEKLLNAVPEAKIMVRVYVAPPPEWCDKHPDHVVRYQDGSTRPVIPCGNKTFNGMYSISSELWQEEAVLTLNHFMEELDKRPCAKSVIGFFLASAGTGEWYCCCPLTDEKEGLYGDCSPAFRAYYSKFLRRKYGSDEALRKAWKRPDVTLDDPPVPPLEERRHLGADWPILDALLYHESASRIVGKKLNDNPETETNLGVFLNPDTAQDSADFYDAWHRGTADAIIRLAEAVRAHYGKTKLVGAFYGSYGCTGYYDLGTAGAVVPILNCGAVDFLAAPGNYDNREPGGYVSQREMQDSFRLHNMMFIVEDDARTHYVADFYKDSMELFTLDDSLHVLKREFGRDICQDMQAWWFDMAGWGGNHAWYDDPDILALFTRQQKIAEYAYSIPRDKGNEIACIFDQESIHCVSEHTSKQMLDYYRTTDFNRIGAGMDYYFHDDLTDPAMPDYKLYLIVNAFALTKAEREAMKAKFAKNGAVAVFLYGSGFICPDADGKRMSVEHIADLVGMTVDKFNGTHSPRYKLEAGHDEMLAFADRDRIYGVEDRVVRSNVWLGNSSTAPFMNPGFYINDAEAAVLGRYGLDGKPALAVKKQPGGWTSIYSAPKYLRSELIASFAKFAGCHLYAHNDDCIYANRNFVTIHAKDTGKRTLYFPKPCSPYEVYEQRFYGRNVTELELFLHRGETLMFSLTGDQF